MKTSTAMIIAAGAIVAVVGIASAINFAFAGTFSPLNEVHGGVVGGNSFSQFKMPAWQQCFVDAAGRSRCRTIQRSIP